jgi:hypothetical protein
VLDRNKTPNERRVFEGEGHLIDQSKREEVFAAIEDWFVSRGVLTQPIDLRRVSPSGPPSR